MEVSYFPNTVLNYMLQMYILVLMKSIKIIWQILYIYMYVCMCVCVCDSLHRDARWIGGLSHQSSDLSHLHNLLHKVVIRACSDTGFEWIKVANYLAN